MNVLDPKVHKTDPMLGPACWRCRWSCRGLVRMAWVRVSVRSYSRLESPARAELELVENIAAAGTGQLQSVQLTQHYSGLLSTRSGPVWVPSVSSGHCLSCQNDQEWGCKILSGWYIDTFIILCFRGQWYYVPYFASDEMIVKLLLCWLCASIEWVQQLTMILHPNLVMT